MIRKEVVILLKKILISGVLITFFTACSPGTNSDQNYFQDEALKSVVLQTLESDSENVSEEDLAKILSLDASDAGITELEGIESLTALSHLDITGNDIDNFSPLQSINTLTEVDIGDVYFTGDLDEPVWDVLESLEENDVDVHFRSRMSFDEHEGPSEGVFYRIQENDQTIYLFGSIHVGDQSLYPLHDQIDEAFEEADHLAVEIDISDINELEAQQAMMQQGMYLDGTTLSDVIDDDIFNETVTHLSGIGLQEPLLDQFQPWFVSMLLSEVALEKTEFTGDDGIDIHFIDRANDKDLPIISLESFESQMDSISSAPEDEQIERLENTLDSFDIYGEELTQMIRIWRSGNTDTFAQLREMDNDVEQFAMDERDLAMTEKIEEFLTKDDGDTYFIVVGALHLAGENSIVDLLEDRGYSVEHHDDFRTN